MTDSNFFGSAMLGFVSVLFAGIFCIIYSHTEWSLLLLIAKIFMVISCVFFSIAFVCLLVFVGELLWDFGRYVIRC